MARNVLIVLVFSLLLFGVASAEIAECEELASEEKYLQAGDCYKSEEEWGLCVYYYMKEAREAEIAWDLGEGSSFQKGLAITYYSPDGKDMKICLANYQDSQLTMNLQEYVAWLTGYTLVPVDPPFNIETTLSNMETVLFAPPDSCQVSAECNDLDSCTIDSCTGIPKDCVNTPITMCNPTSSDECCPGNCNQTRDYDCAECHIDEDCTVTNDSFLAYCKNGMCKEKEKPMCSIDADCVPESPSMGYIYRCDNSTGVPSCVKDSDNGFWLLLVFILGIVLVVIMGGGYFAFTKLATKHGKPQDKPKEPKKKPAPSRKEISVFQKVKPKKEDKPVKTKKDSPLTEDKATKELEKIIKSVEELSETDD